MTASVGDTTELTAPPRGTRPRNRRALIIAAAGRLFYEKGYAHVSMSDVASAVNVAPSAIYRHFPGKAALLFEVVAQGIETFDSTVQDTDPTDLDTFLALLTPAAIDKRHLGALWQREARHLPDAERLELRQRVRATLRSLTVAVQSLRDDVSPEQADLIVASLVNALTSISFHRVELPRAKYEALLLDIAQRIVTFDFSTAAETVRPASPEPANPSRREKLLDAAINLFADRGFASVSIDDIGAAVGIAGPSVYHHFESKQQILIAAMDRGHEMLLTGFDEALADSADDREALRRISDAYVDVAIGHSALISTLITEAWLLDEASPHRARSMQREFIDRWVGVARRGGRDEPPAATRIRVQAAQMLANDLGRTPHLHRIRGFQETVKEVCWTIQA